MYRLIFLIILYYPLGTKAQFSIIPKLAFEYGGIAYYPKSTIRQTDVKITVPEAEGAFGLELALLKKNKKISLVVESKKLFTGFKVIEDTLIFLDGFVGSGSNKTINGSNHLFVGLFYDKINNYLFNSKHFSFFYGGGLGIGLNWSEEYYTGTQNAGYSFHSWGGTNFCTIERWTKPTGHGAFIKLRGGLALHNKKGRQFILLDVYWNQGLLKMQEHTVNYNYGGQLPLPNGRNKTVTDYRFNSRGTTFGSTLSFPLYLKKKKSNRTTSSKPK